MAPAGSGPLTGFIRPIRFTDQVRGEAVPLHVDNNIYNEAPVTQPGD
jgi:hypothetical protein